jgi:hypothetical protein
VDRVAVHLFELDAAGGGSLVVEGRKEEHAHGHSAEEVPPSITTLSGSSAVMVRRARSSTVNCATSITAGQPNSAPPVHADMACSSSSFARTTADMDRLVGAAVAAHGGNARLGPHLGSIRVAVSAIKSYEGFGDVDHTIKELMSL